MDRQEILGMAKTIYADTANKKYPVDTEEHIRSSWNYINKNKNVEDVDVVKRSIVAAWKSVIDQEGPQKSDISLNEAYKDVEQVFNDTFGYDSALRPTTYGYMVDATDTYAIGVFDNDYYQIGYTVDESGIQFDKIKENWVKVERKVTYEPTGKTYSWEKAGARNSSSDLKRLQQIHDYAVANGAQCFKKSLPTEALKAISETDDELVVGNHIVLFGGRDLTGLVIGKNADGSMGEFFTKDTALESEQTKSGKLVVDFEHGRDPDKIGIGRNSLGYVDWSSAKADESGVFVKRILNRRNKYIKMLEPLIKAGLIGNSSEADASKIEKGKNGEIKTWPLVRDTLTVTPMEPRMLTENMMTAIKAIENVPELKELATELTALSASDTNNQKTLSGVNEMDEKELELKQAAAIKAAVEAELKAREDTAKVEAEKAKALKDAEDAGFKKAVEEMKKKGLPVYIRSENKGDDNDGVQAFKAWIATGQANESLISPLSDPAWAGKAAYNITTGASGSYLVPDPLFQQIIAKRQIQSWVRQLPVQSFVTPADHILVPKEDTKFAAFTQTAESAAYAENEATVDQIDLILYKYTKVVKITEEFENFQGTNFDAWLTDALARAVALTENTIFTTGTGSGEPQGINTSAASTGNTVATSATIVPADLTALVGKLGAGYNVQGQCGFLMQNATKWYLKGAQTSGFFAFLNTPAGGDFFGYPAVIDDLMDAYTTTTGYPVIFGNFNYFGIVEKPGMMIQRNPYLYMANGQIGLFANMYRGGAVLQSEAFYRLAGK